MTLVRCFWLGGKSEARALLVITAGSSSMATKRASVGPGPHAPQRYTPGGEEIKWLGVQVWTYHVKPRILPIVPDP
jgi:hypothetical protein